MDFETFIQEVRESYAAARAKHRSLAGWHEGYAVTLEEMDELWDEIKADAPYERKAEEILQIAAMCYAMLAELD